MASIPLRRLSRSAAKIMPTESATSTKKQIAVASLMRFTISSTPSKQHKITNNNKQ